MPVQFGTAYTLGQNTGRNFEYVRNHTWEVYLGTLDTPLLAKSVQIPVTSVEQGELFHANERVKFPMRPNPGNLIIEFYDAINPEIVAELDAWWNQVYNPQTGQMNITSAVKRQGQIIQYSPDWVPQRTWLAQGIFPLHNPLPNHALDYSDQNPVIIQMAFSVDRCYRSTGATGSTNTTGTQPIG